MSSSKQTSVKRMPAPRVAELADAVLRAAKYYPRLGLYAVQWDGRMHKAKDPKKLVSLVKSCAAKPA